MIRIINLGRPRTNWSVTIREQKQWTRQRSWKTTERKQYWRWVKLKWTIWTTKDLDHDTFLNKFLSLNSKSFVSWAFFNKMILFMSDFYRQFKINPHNYLLTTFDQDYLAGFYLTKSFENLQVWGFPKPKPFAF